MLGTADAPVDETDRIMEDCWAADVLMEAANNVGWGDRIVVWGGNGTIEVLFFMVEVGNDDNDDSIVCDMAT